MAVRTAGPVADYYNTLKEAWRRSMATGCGRSCRRMAVRGPDRRAGRRLRARYQGRHRIRPDDERPHHASLASGTRPGSGTLRRRDAARNGPLRRVLPRRQRQDRIAAVAVRPVPRMAATLRERTDSRFTPPMHGPAAPLTDLCVHTGEMRVPLGLTLDIAPDEAEAAFDLLAGFTMFILPRCRLRGVDIAPDDLDRDWGDGAKLTGRAADVLMATLGRWQFLDAVSGPGKDLLAGRLCLHSQPHRNSRDVVCSGNQVRYQSQVRTPAGSRDRVR